MRRAAQPRGARRADRVLRWADRVPRGDRGHLAAQHCADVHGAPDSGGDAVRHLRAPQEGRRGAAPDLHRPDRGGRRVRAAGLRRLPARPKVPGDRGDLGERLGAVYPVLAFPPELRRIIYTTNAVESLNYQLRKIIKNRGHFPNDDAAIKLLWLAIRDIEDKRARQRAKEKGLPPTQRTAPGRLVEGATVQGWKAALGALALAYPRPARRLPHLTPFLRHG